jgi:polyisoprenoid-binding protein YceI
MKLLLLTSLLFSSLLSFDAVVTWKAFKTPLKIGVAGEFDRVETSGDKLENIKLSIDTSSVNTNNSGRDFTLVESFFKFQGVDKIEASVEKINEKVLYALISMNGVQKSVPLQIEKSASLLKARGSIDLSDFSMLPSLKSINTSCFDLHSGKTWQDVEIGVEIK